MEEKSPLKKENEQEHNSVQVEVKNSIWDADMYQVPPLTSEIPPQVIMGRIVFEQFLHFQAKKHCMVWEDDGEGHSPCGAPVKFSFKKFYSAKLCKRN